MLTAPWRASTAAETLLVQPLLRLDLAETVRRVTEPLLHFYKGKGL